MITAKTAKNKQQQKSKEVLREAHRAWWEWNGRWGEGLMASSSGHDPKTDPCKRNLETEERGSVDGRAWED